VKLREELIVWQMIDVVLPVLLVLIGGTVFWFFRHNRN
jgi:hypothetical protein